MDTDISDTESINSDISVLEDEPEIIDEPIITNSSTPNISATIQNPSLIDLEDNEEEFSKIDHLNVNILHPELQSINYKELLLLCKIKKDKKGNIVDKNHKTLPILTKYEKTKILGQRAKQIEEGHLPFIKINNIIDHYTIAKMELEQNKIPFIIRRPLPDGSSEYWRVQDLIIL